MRRAPTRRALLRDGLGALALSQLVDEAAWARPGRAKRVIQLFMVGGPSQIDLFDPKPTLARYDGQPLPEALARGVQFPFIRGTPRLLASPYRFARHGRSGAAVSELLPHTARIADRLTFVRSMRTPQVNHGPAQLLANTGHQTPGRPGAGAWISYGLGSANRDLPSYVVLLSGERQPDAGRSLWGSGFLPNRHGAVELRGEGEPVLFLADPPGVDRATARARLRTLVGIERARLDAGATDDPAVQARIEALELAFRMQRSVPELTDLSREPASVHALYGTTPGRGSYANNCLLARRLVERGVRFVQLFHRGWDTHGANRSDDLVNRLPALCEEVDRASAALVTDLGRRGLLDDTLVVWGGEFGRTPMNEGRQGSKFLGRDHHGRAFTMWLAGGGTRPGVTYGATDELGWDVTERPVEVADLHATMLHLLGIDHRKLTFRFSGREFRLTDVAGEVVSGLCA